MALYPLTFDNAEVAEYLFLSGSANSFRKGAQLGITEETYGLYSQVAVQEILGEVWRRNGRYWEVQPTLPISRLKILLDEFIATEFQKNLRISFQDIFVFLMNRGFMPSNIYAFLIGFLMKEYAGYRWSEESAARDAGGTLTVEQLAMFIVECMGYFLSPKKISDGNFWYFV